MKRIYNTNEKKGQTFVLRIIMIVLIAACGVSNAIGQAGINTDGSAPDPSAMLDLKSTEMGFLPPRMTKAQRNAIEAPAEGLVIYNTDSKAIELFNGQIWTSNSGEFKCGTSQITDIDGNVYNTVIIGEQCWMAENLNRGTRIDMLLSSTDNEIVEKYCYPNTDEGCLENGGLYKWNEMMEYQTDEGIQGICPSGWHLPSSDEWLTMVNYLGGWVEAANKLKEAGTQHWGAGNQGTNSSYFTAIPCPFLSNNAMWYNLYNAWFFTSSENSLHPLEAGNYWINGEETGASEVHSNMDYQKNDAMSVRCVHD